MAKSLSNKQLFKIVKEAYHRMKVGDIPGTTALVRLVPAHQRQYVVDEIKAAIEMMKARQ